MQRRKTILMATASMMAVGGVVFAVSGAAQSPLSGQAKERAAANPEWTVVRAQAVTADGARQEQTYTGIVRARYETDLAFRVGAKIASRHVEVGQRVQAGTLLFRLDPTDFQLAVKAAEADVIAAEAEVLQTSAEDERTNQLHRSGTVSRSDLDKTRSARDVAISRRDRSRETLSLARNRLSYTELLADADGVITALPAESGQVVAEGQVVARLARDGEREATVSIPEHQAIAVQTALASVTLWSAPGHAYPATLRELSPIADPATRTYQARFSIQQSDNKVVLGMTATVHLSAADARPKYVLPLSSLIRNGSQPAVWLMDRATGRLTLATVTVSEYRQESVLIADGVKPGQWVVTAGVQKLDAGMRVRVWEGN